MDGKQWVSRVFFVPPIYFVIDRHMEWQDVVALMRTCKTLYHDWLSADTQRWKKARLFQALNRVVGIPYYSKLNMIRVVRNRAIASRMGILLCMGGCGKGVDFERVISRTLPYVVCVECAISPLRWGNFLVRRHLERAGMIWGDTMEEIRIEYL
jgi:hypothetical protein